MMIFSTRISISRPAMMADDYQASRFRCNAWSLIISFRFLIFFFWCRRFSSIFQMMISYEFRLRRPAAASRCIDFWCRREEPNDWWLSIFAFSMWSAWGNDDDVRRCRCTIIDYRRLSWLSPTWGHRGMMTCKHFVTQVRMPPIDDVPMLPPIRRRCRNTPMLMRGRRRCRRCQAGRAGWCADAELHYAADTPPRWLRWWVSLMMMMLLMRLSSIIDDIFIYAASQPLIFFSFRKPFSFRFSMRKASDCFHSRHCAEILMKYFDKIFDVKMWTFSSKRLMIAMCWWCW